MEFPQQLLSEDNIIHVRFLYIFLWRFHQLLLTQLIETCLLTRNPTLNLWKYWNLKETLKNKTKKDLKMLSDYDYFTSSEDSLSGG